MQAGAIRAVVDTNVLFEGLTRIGPSSTVVDAWAAKLFQPCVSTALALEYQDVLSRKLRPDRADVALKVLQALLVRCEYVPVYFSYRPSSRDPGDDFVVECVLNGRAALVTRNVRDFEGSASELGFRILTPEQFTLQIQEGGRE